jgi:hypothetical protein
VSSALKRLPRPGRHGREQLVHTLLGRFGPSRVEMTSVAKSRRTVATSADRVATLVASAMSPSSSRLASGCVRIRPLIGRHGSLSAAVCVCVIQRQCAEADLSLDGPRRRHGPPNRQFASRTAPMSVVALRWLANCPSSGLPPRAVCLGVDLGTTELIAMVGRA